MNYNWYKIDKTKIDNLAEYIKSYMAKYKDEHFEIYIGTDSQKIRKRNTVLFASVICIYRKGKGAHIIYSKHRRVDKMFRDKLVRLRTEVGYSIEIANYLMAHDVLVNPNIMTIHIDISPSVKHASNIIYQEAVGWVRGMGYLVETKPSAPAASYCADYICKNKNIEFQTN